MKKFETTVKNFTVGEVFNDQFIKEKLSPSGFFMGKKFIKELVDPNKNKIIKIDENIGKLKTYGLPEAMNCSDIQKYTNSIPLTEDQLFLILYLLICDFHVDNQQNCLKILGTKYYEKSCYQFHVRLSSEKLLSVHFYQLGLFYLTSYDFNNGISGGLFCYLNNKPSLLKN